MHHMYGVCTPPCFYRGLATSWALKRSSGHIAPKSYDGLSGCHTPKRGCSTQTPQVLRPLPIWGWCPMEGPGASK